MAKILGFTDENGVAHPNAVWLPMFVAFDHGGKNGRIVFQSYHDVTALATGKRPLGRTKEYAFSGAAYDATVAAHPDAFLAVIDGAYAIAESTLDTLSDPENANSAKVAFFAGATDLILE